MTKAIVGTMVLSAALGVLAACGVASASSLDVEGGVLQTWQFQAPVEEHTVVIEPGLSDVPETGEG